jgi:hypothetical protein
MRAKLRHGTLALVGLAAAVGTSARADEASIPAGYDRVELSDLTFTLRDDDFASISTDPSDPLSAYVGTYQGRFYKTDDGGHTWTESTVISEQRPLWSTPGSSIFFGGIRAPGPTVSEVNLLGRDPQNSPLHADHIPSELPRIPLAGGAQTDPLDYETQVSAGGGVSALGIGLSSRSPRLSILTGSRGRPVPVLNRAKFLADRTLRGTAVFGVTVDPSDRRILFAATQNGLYKSYDAGESWSRTFAGLTAAERVAIRIAVRPGNPKLMILGTTSGAYTSIDNGDNWSKIGTVGGAPVYDVAFDPKDPAFIYLATSGGVLRSADGGQNFESSFYSTFPAEADVRTLVVDPFDSNTGYIGTMRGAFVTHKLRTATLSDWAPLEGVQSILSVAGMGACSKHKGHLYALTRMEMNTINYGADAPESAILESWDGGHTWRQIFTGQSDGTVASFATDTKDPDALWIAWTKALHRLERASGRKADADEVAYKPGELGPPIGDVILAALRYQGLEMNDFVDHISLPKASSILPRKFTITASVLDWSSGATLDDAAFAPQRYLQSGDSREWLVMAWATWSLPSLDYSPDNVPMLRQRINIMTDEIRRRVVESVRRSYGEMMRIEALLAASKLDLETRVTYTLKIEQLAAIVDLSSGGYLSRWQKQHRRKNAR